MDPHLEAAGDGTVPPGTLVGEYEIEGLIGAGGMGEVYRVRHPVIGKRAAMKVMNETCSANPLNVARFVDEAKAVNAIGHPNIVDIFSFGHIDGRSYFVMELLVGESLRARMDRDRFDTAHALDILDAVLRALEAAHAAGIVHRDLKPDNIFLVAARDDEPERVKLLDFGIAKLVASAETSPSASRSQRTLTGTVIGTPSYMSPEQASGTAVGGPSDVYSLGVIAFELVTGRLPFEADSGVQLMAKHIDHPPPRPSSVAEVPAAVEQLIVDMLDKAPAQRPTPGQARARVEQLRLDPGELIGTRRANRPSRDAPTVPTAPSAGPARAASATRALTTLHRTGPRAGGSRRRRTLVVVAAVVALAAAAAVAAVVALGDRGTATDAATTADGDAAWFRRAPAGANESYLLGLRALHDGYPVEAFAELEAAEKQDGALAAAALRRSILDRTTYRRDQARLDFARAVEYQDRLDPRDRALFAAYRLIVQDKPDPAAWEQALAQLSDANPRDPELAYYAGLAHQYRGAPESALAAYERAVANDPQFASAYAAIAAQAFEVGDRARARRAIATCLALPRRSPACSKENIRVLGRAGDAAGVLAESEAWLKADPAHGDEASAYRAEAMFALGRPRAAVEEAARQRTRRLGQDRSRTKFFWERELALVHGDFAAARQALAGQREYAEASSIEWQDHAAATIAEVELDEETGRGADAAAAAADFLAKQGAWIPDDKPPHLVVAADPTPQLLASELRAGTIDRAAFVAARAAWVAKWKALLPPRYLRTIWLVGYAAIATTRELADDAIAARASFDATTDPDTLPFEQSLALGTLYAFDGEASRARPYLESVIDSLWTLHAVIEETQAVELYGEVVEPTDRAAACAAYATVLERWGGEPTSQTAARARARSSALGCAAK